MIANSAVLEFVGRDDEVVWQEQGEQGELTSSMKENQKFCLLAFTSRRSPFIYIHKVNISNIHRFYRFKFPFIGSTLRSPLQHQETRFPLTMNSLYNQALKQSNALRKDLDAFQDQISSSTSSSSTAPTSPAISSVTALQGTFPLQSALTNFSL